MKNQEWNIAVGNGKEERRFSIQVESAANGRSTLRMDGRAAVVSAVQVGPGRYSIIDEIGNQYGVDFDGVLSSLKASIDGEVFSATTVQKDLRSALLGIEPDSAVGEIHASMPGKVVKVLCKGGDVVKAGQPLLVIEAMKMENEVRSSGNGKIETIVVQEGQTVESGQVLLRIGGAS